LLPPVITGQLRRLQGGRYPPGLWFGDVRVRQDRHPGQQRRPGTRGPSEELTDEV